MQNLLLSFNVVAPLMVYMLIGALLRRFHIVSEDVMRGVNRIVFFVIIPALCFTKISACSLSEVFQTPYLLLLALFVIGLFVLSFLLVPLFEKDDRRRGVLIQGVFRSNDAIFGLPVAAALFGDDHLTLMTLGVAISVPLFNICAVIAMERYRGGKINVLRMLLQIVKNPIVISCVLGLVFNVCGLRLPSFLSTPISSLGSTAAPIAFIALGGLLSLGSIQKNRRVIAVVSVIRLILVPSFVIGILYACGFRGEPLVVALILYGAPVAMTTCSMAAAMGADDELAAELVAVTSALSILTMFLFIFLFKQLGVF